VDKLLREDCFYPLAQPIFQLSNDQLVGYELLTRSDIEDIQMPADLFRFTLENNILTHVDLRCLRSCIGVAGHFCDSVRLHVNLFPSTMIATPIDSLVGLLARAGRGRTVCVEISEQQFIGEPSYLKEHMEALRDAGVLVAIDDLGYGRSSLESLIILEPDIVKIDRLYIDGVASTRTKRKSLERMLKMIRGLGAEEVAEGIERPEDLAVLKEMGVRFGQGYLLGKPRRVQPGMPGRESSVQIQSISPIELGC
jgi:EAL domain-containing protein (putative c-di-GMP-specific phosphodiesterase class I)